MKSLVAYFSATGTTKILAEELANVVGADTFEIQPTIPYTNKDLDWTSDNSRSSKEMANPNSRPEVANEVANMASYDTIFVGFPIWWYVAPTIVNTFLEHYNLTNKIIIPFATSGGSGIGDPKRYLAPSCKGAKILQGKRFSPNTSIADLKAWINEIKKQI